MSEESQPNISKTRRSMFRFSLRTLVLLMTIAGLAGAIVRMSIEVEQWRE